MKKSSKTQITNISKMIAMTYEGKYGDYPIKLSKTWYDINGVQWYTCEKDDTLYICIQGSRANKDNNKDWKDNLNFKQIKSPGIKSHKFHEGHYEQTLVIYRQIIKLYKSYKNVYICGHSLGGALAQILAMLMSYSKIRIPKTVRVITEGAPRSMNYSAARWFNKNISESIRIVNGDDPVTKVPFRITLFWMYWHVKGKMQIGTKKGILKRLLKWKQWRKEKLNHSPLDYTVNLTKYYWSKYNKNK